MRRIHVLSVALLLIGILCPSRTEAAAIVRIDMDRNTPGIQSTIAVSPNAPIEAAVTLELDGGVFPSATNIDSFDFSVLFRNSEAQVGAADFLFFEAGIGFINLAGAPTNLFPAWSGANLPPNPPNTTLEGLTLASNTLITNDAGIVDPTLGSAGIFRDVDAGSLSATSFGPIGPVGEGVPIYNFNLTALTPTGDASVIDVLPVFTANSFLLGGVAQGPILAFGGSITATAVPEPSSFAVLGLGAFYFGRRKLRRGKNAKTETAA